MAAIFCNAGEREILDRAFAALPQPDYWMHLYSNDFDPFAEMPDDASDFVECTFDGYEPVQITNWDVSDTEAGVAVTYGDECRFTAGSGLAGSQNAYGYYVTSDEAGTSLLWAERFADAPFVFDSPGVRRRIGPSVNLRTMTPP